jgi:hypothetical protein
MADEGTSHGQQPLTRNCCKQFQFQWSDVGHAELVDPLRFVRDGIPCVSVGFPCPSSVPHPARDQMGTHRVYVIYDNLAQHTCDVPVHGAPCKRQVVVRVTQWGVLVVCVLGKGRLNVRVRSRAVLSVRVSGRGVLNVCVPSRCVVVVCMAQRGTVIIVRVSNQCIVVIVPIQGFGVLSVWNRGIVVIYMIHISTFSVRVRSSRPPGVTDPARDQSEFAMGRCFPMEPLLFAQP